MYSGYYVSTLPALSLSMLAIFLIFVYLQEDSTTIFHRALLSDMILDREASRIEELYHKITAGDIYNDKKLLYNKCSESFQW
jgi:hypothetical protein